MLNVLYNLILNTSNFVSGIQNSMRAVISLQEAVGQLRDTANTNIGDMSRSSLDSFYRLEQAATRVHGTFNTLKGSMRELFEIGVQSQTLDSTISFMAKNIHAEVGDINVAVTELTASGQRSIMGAKEALKSALSLNIPLDTAVASIKAFSNALTAAGKSQDTIVAIFDSIRTMQSQRLDEYGITKNIDQAINDEIRYLQQLKMSGQYVAEYDRILKRFNNSGEIRKENLRQEEIQQLAVNNLAREAMILQTSYGAILEVSQRARTNEKRTNDYEADVAAMGVAIVKMNELLEARKKYQAMNPGTSDRDAQAKVAMGTFYKEDKLTKLLNEKNKKAGIGDNKDLYFAGSGTKHKPLENFLLAQELDKASIPKEEIEAFRKKIEEGNLLKKDLDELASKYKINTQILQYNTFAGVNTAAMDTVKNKIDIIKSSILQIKSDVGGELLKIFSGPISGISELVQWISTLSETAKKNIAMIITALTGLVGVLSVALSTVFLFRMAAPIFASISAAAGVVTSAFTMFAGVASVIAGVTGTITALGSALFGLGGVFAAVVSSIGYAAIAFTGLLTVVTLVQVAIAGVLVVIAGLASAAAVVVGVIEAVKEYKKLSEGSSSDQKGTFWDTMNSAMKEFNDTFSGIRASFKTFMEAFAGESLKDLGASVIKKLADVFSFVGRIFEKSMVFVTAYVKALKEIWKDKSVQSFFSSVAEWAKWLIGLLGKVAGWILYLQKQFYIAYLDTLKNINFLNMGGVFGAVGNAIKGFEKSYSELLKKQAEYRKKQIEEDNLERDRTERKKRYEKDKETVARLSSKRAPLTKEEEKELEATKKRVTEYENSSDFKINETGSTRTEEEKLQDAIKKVQERISFFEELKRLSEYEANTQESYIEIRKQIFNSNLEEYRKMIGLGFLEGGSVGLKRVAEFRLKAIKDAIDIFNLTLDKHKKANDAAKKLTSSNKELLDTLTAYFYDSKIASAKRYDDQFASLLERNKSIELAQTNILSLRKDIELAKAEALDAAQRLINNFEGDKFDELSANFQAAEKNAQNLQYKLAASKEALKDLIKDYQQELKKQEIENRIKFNQLNILSNEPRSGLGVIKSYSDQFKLIIEQLRLQSKNGEDLLLDATNQFSGVYNKIFSKINSVVNENYIGIEQTLSAYEIMAKNVEGSLVKIEETRKKAQNHYQKSKLEYDSLQSRLMLNANARVEASQAGDSEKVRELDKESLNIKQKLEVLGKSEKESALMLAMTEAQRNTLLKAQLDIAKEKEALLQKEIASKMSLLELEDKVVAVQVKKLREVGKYNEADIIARRSDARRLEMQSRLDSLVAEQENRLRLNSDIVVKNTPDLLSIKNEGLSMVGKWVKATQDPSNKNSLFAKASQELSQVKIVNPQNIYIEGTDLKTLISKLLTDYGLAPELLARIYREKTEEEKKEQQKQFNFARYGETKTPNTTKELDDKTSSFFTRKSFGLSSEASTSGTVWHSSHLDHHGIDIKTPLGTPLAAPLDMEILSARSEGGYGKTIRARLADGINVLLAHLSEINARAGSKVSAGTRIGLTGNSGVGSGPHLHQEMYMYSGGKKISLDKVIQAYIINALEQNPNMSRDGLAEIRKAAIDAQNRINVEERRQNKSKVIAAKELPESEKKDIAKGLKDVISSVLASYKDRSTVMPTTPSAGSVIPPPPALPQITSPTTTAPIPTAPVSVPSARPVELTTEQEKEQEKKEYDNELKKFQESKNIINQKYQQKKEVQEALKRAEILLIAQAKKSNGANRTEIEATKKEIQSAKDQLEKITKEIKELERLADESFYKFDKKGSLTYIKSYELNSSEGGIAEPESIENPGLMSLSKRSQEATKNFVDGIEARTQRIPTINFKLFDDSRISGFLDELYSERSKIQKQVQKITNDLNKNYSTREELSKQLGQANDAETIKKVKEGIVSVNGEIDGQNIRLEENQRKWLAVSDAIDKVEENTGFVSKAIAASVSKNFDNFADQVSGSFGAAFKAALTEPTDSRDIRTGWQRFSDAYREAGASAMRDNLANIGAEILAAPQRLAFDGLKNMGSSMFNSLKNQIVGSISGVDVESIEGILKIDSDSEKTAKSIESSGKSVADSLYLAANEIKRAAKNFSGPSTSGPRAGETVPISSDLEGGPKTPVAVEIKNTNQSGSELPDVYGSDPPESVTAAKSSEENNSSSTSNNKEAVGTALGAFNNVVSGLAMTASLVVSLGAMMSSSVKKVDQKIQDVNDIFESNENIRGVIVGEQNIGIGKLNELFQPIAVDLRTIVNALSNQFGVMPASSSNVGIANNSLAVTVSGKIDLHLVDNPNIGKEIQMLSQQAIANGISSGYASTTL